jgi:indolepyruvate ferredoxin oxidoreductase alpha subunit
VVLLENQTTALSGGQPHPATAHDARGVPRPPVDLAALARVIGATATVVDPRDIHALDAVYEHALASPGVSVVIVREPCPRGS